ncbi:hypothetical protein M3Y95_00827300 [Aphelenchoides besseyi]|nr:hypothetical protein M3Y95_00827300 [Aphelenchoides besseyi]
MILRPHREGWALLFVLFLLCKPTAIASSSNDCLEVNDGSWRYSGKCTKFDVDVKTEDESLVIKMDHEKSGVVSLAEITMTIGKCDLKGRVSNNNGQGTFVRDETSANFPITFKVSKDKIVYGTNIAMPCTVSFEPLGKDKDAGFKVAVKYESAVNLPGLRLTFDKTEIIKERKEENEWSWRGWRIYACIVGGIAGVLLIASIITSIVCWCKRRRNKKIAAGQAAGTSTTNVTTATSKLSTTNASQATSNTSVVTPQAAAANENMKLPKVAQDVEKVCQEIQKAIEQQEAQQKGAPQALAQQVAQQAVSEQQQGAQQAAPGQQAAQQPAQEQPKPAATLPVQAEKNKSTESGHTTELIQQNVERQAREKEEEEKREKQEKEKQAKQEQEQKKQTPRARKSSTNNKRSASSNSSKSSKGSKGSKKRGKKDKVAKPAPEDQPGTSKIAGGPKHEAEELLPQRTQSEHSVMGDQALKLPEEVGSREGQPLEAPPPPQAQNAPVQNEGPNPKSWELPNDAPNDQDKKHIREHFAANFNELFAYSNRHPVTQKTLDALAPWYRKNQEEAKDHRKAAKNDPAFDTDCQFFVFVKLLAEQRGLKWPPNA